MLADLPLILSCWFLLLLWQLVGFPLIYHLYGKKLVDSGWAFGRLITWLTIGTIVWFAGHIGLPANQPLVIYFLFFALLVFAVYYYWQNQVELLKFLKKNRSLILTQEVLFLIFFVFLSYVRGFNPVIEGLEKFMDVGLIATYLRSPALPAHDIWLAGHTVNYYTFGHFLGAVATQFWSISVDYSYNLLLAFLMGLVASQSFSIVINLLQHKSGKNKIDEFSLIKSGSIGALLMVLAGNGHTAWYFLSNLSFEGYWYPDATRFIERTIHEFPGYSFIVSDLHAHVWSVPLVLLIIINIYLWVNSILSFSLKKIKLNQLLKQPFIFWSALVGFQLGLIMSTSAWDFLIYGLLLGVIGIVLLFIDQKYLKPLIYSAITVGLAAFFGASPWFLGFESISEGARFAEESSPLWQLLVLWLPHVVMSAIAFAVARKLLKKSRSKKPPAELLMIIAMTVLAWTLLLLPELIYMKDIYPDHPRANTMFKLTFQAFILMSLATAWLSSSWKYLKSKKSIKHVKKALLYLFLVIVFAYPYFGYKSFYIGLKNYQGLDGLNWLNKRNPSDYSGILWLRDHVVGKPVVLEAVGESYTTYARVSSFTGLPTVLGWRVHQWLWRGGFEIPSQRTDEVNEIYNNPQSIESKRLLDQYQVKYIFVGEKEYEAYPNLDLEALIDQGEIVFQQGQTYIIKLD